MYYREWDSIVISDLGAYVFDLQESIIASVDRHIRDKGMLVCLRAETHVDSWNRLVVLESKEYNWRPVFRHLAAHCKAILVFPECSEGIVEEIVFLRDAKLMRKTIFVMPPAAEGSRRKISWQIAAKSLASHGFVLPSFSESGSLLLLNCDLQIVHEVSLGGCADCEAVGSAIEEILPFTQGTWKPLKDVYMRLQSFGATATAESVLQRVPAAAK